MGSFFCNRSSSAYTCNPVHRDSCCPACCRGYNGQIEDALVEVAGREAIRVACVVVGIWDLGGFEVGAAGN